MILYEILDLKLFTSILGLFYGIFFYNYLVHVGWGAAYP